MSFHSEMSTKKVVEGGGAICHAATCLVITPADKSLASLPAAFFKLPTASESTCFANCFPKSSLEKALVSCLVAQGFPLRVSLVFSIALWSIAGISGESTTTSGAKGSVKVADIPPTPTDERCCAQTQKGCWLEQQDVQLSPTL